MKHALRAVYALAVALLLSPPALADATPSPVADGSVRLVGQKRFLTTSNSTLTQAQQKCSVSFFVKYDGAPASSRGVYLLIRDYYSGPFILLNTNSNGALQINFAWVASDGSRVSTVKPLADGVSHHVAMTWDGAAAEQWVYIDGVGTRIGSVAGVTYSNGSRSLGFGGNEAVNLDSGCSVWLDDYGIWDGYALTAQDVADLRDSKKRPDDIGVSATRRVLWTLGGTEGANATVGGAGFANRLGTGPDLTYSDGGGSAAFQGKLDWSPSADVAKAYVTSCGSLVAFTFKSVPAGVRSTPELIYSTPVFKKNGVTLAASAKPVWLTGFHDAVLVPLSESVGPGDTVTVSAPVGWAKAFHGLADGLSNKTVENRVGKSSHGVESVPRTLRVGVNMAFLGAGSNSQYSLPKNLAYRMDPFFPRNAATYDATGKVDTITGSPYATLAATTDANGLDATTHPGPKGLHAIGWDEDEAGNPVDFSLVTPMYGGVSDTYTVITEKPEYANPGTTVGGRRVGVVRVFDVQSPPNPPSVNRQISLRIACVSGRPRFSNLVVYGPKDFAPASPTVLDRSNPYAVSEVMKERLAGAGAIRWMDTITENMGGSIASEPEHIRTIDSFRWGWGSLAAYPGSIGHVQIRPYVQSATPYFYSSSIGDKYAVTLASPLAAGDTVATITYDPANPVFRYLRLFAGTEEMRIEGVSGSLSSGQSVQVTLKRGTNGTATAAHPAGAIQAGYRMASAAIGQLETGQGVAWEMVTDGPHGLWSGAKLGFTGSGWPTLAFTDGTTIQPASVMNDLGGVAWVTGPNTYVQACWWPTVGPGAVTLSAAQDLNPANNKTTFALPSMPQFPYEFAARATGQIPGANLWLNIPHSASDDLVRYIATIARDNFPAGRRVYVELTNEPWNFGFPQWRYFRPISMARYTGAIGPYAAVVQRSARVWSIFEEVFGARASEVRRTINFQPRSSFGATLDYARSQSPPVRVDACAVAPYIDVPDGDAVADDPQTSACQVAWATPENVDLFTHHLYYDVGSRSFAKSFLAEKSEVDAYNAATGNHCALVGYEGGVQLPLLGVSGTLGKQRSRDMLYDPGWYWVEQEFMALVQNSGFEDWCIFNYGGSWFMGRYCWEIYSWMYQDHGYGDGRDGKADNRLYLAEPGLPNSKPSNVNQDQVCVSVRGQALLDWNNSVSAPPPPPPVDPPPAPPAVHPKKKEQRETKGRDRDRTGPHSPPSIRPRPRR